MGITDVVIDKDGNQFTIPDTDDYWSEVEDGVLTICRADDDGDVLNCAIVARFAPGWVALFDADRVELT